MYVTGTVGDALVGLQCLERDCGETEDKSGEEAADLAPQVARYLRPQPRVRMGMLLGRNRAATACMDLSDGLADAVRQIAAASQVGITIDAAALPIAEQVRRWHMVRKADPAMAVLQGGDDYELLFTARPSHAGRLRALRGHEADLPITKIGEITVMSGR